MIIHLGLDYLKIEFKGDFMARPISPTPTLYGEDARRFLEKMNQPPTEKEKKFWKEVNSQRFVPF